MAHTRAPKSKPALLGTCVVYLGGLNYFLSVDERCPIVSKIGTDGELCIRIAPYLQAPLDQFGALQSEDDMFVRYEHKDVDAAEEQVCDYMDRTLQYRVHIPTVTLLRKSRKYSHIYVKYAFFKAGSVHTECLAVLESGCDVHVAHERKYNVDVSDAFVKYVTSTNLMLERPAEAQHPVLTFVIVAFAHNCEPGRMAAHRPSDGVDAIWQEMQQQNECRRVDVDRLLKKAMVTSKKQRPKKAGMAKSSTSTIKSTCETETETSPSRAHGHGHQLVKDGNHTNSLERQSEAQPFNLQRELNRLSDEASHVRKQAALALEAHFLIPARHKQHGDEHSAIVPVSDPTDTADDDAIEFGELAKPLFKRLNDPVEKVRDVNIRIVTNFIAKEEDLLRFIPYLMPAITNRINSQYAYDEENQQFTRDQFLQAAFERGRIFVEEDQVTRIKPEEPSEEIRLLFLALIEALLSNVFARNASSILHAYMFDILVILVSGLHDNFHEINIKACSILRSISNNMVSVMKHFSVAMVRAAKDLLLHRLARVRIAGIETIRALVTCPNRDKCKGSGTEAIADLIGHRDENVIPISAFYTTEIRLNYFAKLDQDANALVRKVFFDMISDWMTNLPDRYDHESRLMPYLLSAVSDENDEISRDAMQTLGFLGRRYEDEHGEGILEMKQYGVDGKNPNYNYHKQLPPPFHDHRPSLGTRLYVRGHARRFLNPVLRELNNWQSKTRGHAARLLKSIIMYCEEQITVDAHLLIQTLLRIWNEPHISDGLKVIAELTGRFTAPDTYMLLILSRIRGDADVTQVVSPAQTAAAIELLQLLMEGSLDKTLLPHIQDILETTSCNHILAFEHGDVKHALGKLILELAMLLERRGSDAMSACFLQHGRLTSIERVHDGLFDVALVVSKANHADAVAWRVLLGFLCLNARKTLDVLAQLESRKSLTELFDAHFANSINRVGAVLEAMTTVQWTPICPEQLILEALLKTADLEVGLSPNASPMLEQIFSTALMAPVDAESPGDDKGAESDRRRATERREIYKRLLESLLTRVNNSPQQPEKVEASGGIVERLQDLLTSSQAAAA
ncbi:hypothetical protein FI667_g3590, partial [Globisporangium splendens]